MKEMFVTGVALDVRTNIPLVILNDNDREYTLPIWIGQAEAQAIARGLTGAETERPMTHDLLVDIIDSLEAEVDSIEINSYEDSTFFASLILVDKNGQQLAIDARPSDAISVALRMEASIFVSEKILDEVCNELEALNDSEDEIEPISDPEARKEFKEFLKNVKASDFSLDRSQGFDFE
jgi:bifunctional DNase/RNase